MSFEDKELLETMKEGVQRIFSTSFSMPDHSEGTPQTNVNTHNHLKREVLFVLDGESDFMLNGDWHRIKKGDAIFIEPWEEHNNFYSQDEHDIKHLWFFIHPKYMYVFFVFLDHAGNMTSKLYHEEFSGLVFKNLLMNWDRIHDTKLNDSYLFMQLMRTSINQVLLELVYKILYQAVDSQRKPIEKIIDFVAGYIENYHGKNCDLPQLSKLTGYSQYHLSHLFRKHLGKTIGAAINEARMSYIIVQKGRLNAKELSDKLGFSSVNSFWKWRRNNQAMEKQLREESERLP